MSYTIPKEHQPSQAQFEFDLASKLRAIVSLKSTVPDDAFTAEILGTERAGHGAIIDDSGLIATIGYLVTEADTIWIQTANGQTLEGHLLGYDYESGFGLVQPLGKIDIAPLTVGNSANLASGAKAILAAYGGTEYSICTQVASKGEFVGYWEYIVEDAIFTSPPHPNWGGAALIGEDGLLYGIASLYTQEIPGQLAGSEGNMIVPIDLLKDIQGELTRFGQTTKPPRPWLGMFAAENDQRLVIAGVYENAPAADADLRAGDEIISVAEESPTTLGGLFRCIWSLGPAGTVIPLKISRDGQLIQIHVRSSDRRSHWKRPELH